MPVKQYGSGGQAEALTQGQPMSAEQVEQLHQNDDMNVRRESHHHDLGSGPTQAAAGDHIHDGGDSALLLTGFTLTGSRGGVASTPSIIAALVRLGAVDSTTT